MLEQPDLTPINEKQYELKNHYIYEGKDEFGLYRIVVPQGFLTDGASIPRLFWTLTGLKPDGLHRAAALVHDFLYAYRGRIQKSFYQRFDQGNWESRTREFTRAEADHIFKDLMVLAGCSKTKLNLMYWAVRSFGWGPW